MLRDDFEIFTKTVNGKRFAYLDNAATTQKPGVVIARTNAFYGEEYATINRGVYKYSENATEAYEKARKVVADFVNCQKPKEIIFTSGTTESINLVAYSWGLEYLKKGDEIVLSISEHHANIVPWQIVAKKTGAKLVFVNIDDFGLIDVDDLRSKVNQNTALVGLVHASNVLGGINDVKTLVKEIRRLSARAKILIDSAQTVGKMRVSVQSIGADFLVFSGHKILGPTGVGVLWVREEVAQSMPPFLGGGSMIKDVTMQDFVWNDIPYRFEAGTPNIAGVLGLAAAIGYLESVGIEKIEAEDRMLAECMIREFEIREIGFLGPNVSASRVGIFTFNVEGIHPHDLASVLDAEGVAVRSGLHCAHPLMKKLGIESAVRASLYFYNDEKDILQMFEAIEKAKKILKVK